MPRIFSLSHNKKSFLYLQILFLLFFNFTLLYVNYLYAVNKLKRSSSIDVSSITTNFNFYPHTEDKESQWQAGVLSRSHLSHNTEG